MLQASTSIHPRAVMVKPGALGQSRVCLWAVPHAGTVPISAFVHDDRVTDATTEVRRASPHPASNRCRHTPSMGFLCPDCLHLRTGELLRLVLLIGFALLVLRLLLVRLSRRPRR